MSNPFFPDPKRTCSRCDGQIDQRSAGLCRPCFRRTQHSKSKGYGGQDHIRHLYGVWKRRARRA